MLRCPFNGFSKCDGSCPFSTDNFNSCRLASGLIAIEGLARGIHEQTAAQSEALEAIIEEAKNLSTRVAAQAAQAPAEAQTQAPKQPMLPITCAEFVARLGREHFVGLRARDAYQEFCEAVSNGSAIGLDDSGNAITSRGYSSIVKKTHRLMLTYTDNKARETTYIDATGGAA